MAKRSPHNGRSIHCVLRARGSIIRVMFWVSGEAVAVFPEARSVLLWRRAQARRVAGARSVRRVLRTRALAVAVYGPKKWLVICIGCVWPGNGLNPEKRKWTFKSVGVGDVIDKQTDTVELGEKDQKVCCDFPHNKKFVVTSPYNKKCIRKSWSRKLLWPPNN